jgi:hypothetical protein
MMFICDATDIAGEEDKGFVMHHSAWNKTPTV